MGKSLVPTVLNAIFICGPRILWVLLVYPVLLTGDPARDYVTLLLCYPISWALSAVAQVISYILYRKEEGRKLAAESCSVPT